MCWLTEILQVQLALILIVELVLLETEDFALIAYAESARYRLRNVHDTRLHP